MNKVESSNLIYNKNPGHYGNGNDYFQMASSKVINEAVTTLSEAKEKRLDLTKVFFVLLDRFEKTRNDIALTTGTLNGNRYGLGRDSEAGMEEGNVGFTPLSEKYSEYGDKMLDLLQSILREKMPHDLKGFTKTRNGKTVYLDESTYEEKSTCCGRQSSFELTVFDKSALAGKGWYVLGDPQADEKKDSVRENKIGNICKDQVGVKARHEFLKKKDRTLYHEANMHFFISSMEKTFPSPANVVIKKEIEDFINQFFPSNENKEYTAKNKLDFVNAIMNAFPVEGNDEEKKLFLKNMMETCFPSIKKSKHHEYKMAELKILTDNFFPPEQNVDYRKSHWVLATSRLEIEGRNMPALSLYLTYMNFDGIHDPVERMKGRSRITIIHQDAFLIEGTLQEISKIFAKAALWNPNTQDLSALKDEVGLLRYLFAHNMCTFNGAAAMGEWCEKLLYNHHGYTALQTETDKACDLEALTARSLGAFMDVYREMTHVEKLPSLGCEEKK